MPDTPIRTDEPVHTSHAPGELKPGTWSADDLAQMEEYLRLRDEDDAGRLTQYQGEYVITGNKIILAHGRDLLAALERAEAEAKLRGIPSDKLFEYFVP